MAEISERVQQLKAQIREARAEYRRKEQAATEAEERLLRLKDELETLGEFCDPDDEEEG